MLSKFRLFMVITLSLIIGLSCGKVTQEVAESTEQEVNVFDFLFKTTLISENDQRLNPKAELAEGSKVIPLENALIAKDGAGVYVVVQGIKENEGFEILSWGKMKIDQEEIESKTTEQPGASPTTDTTESSSTANAESPSPNADLKEPPTEIEEEIEEEYKWLSTAYTRHSVKITAAKFEDSFLKLVHTKSSKEGDSDTFKADGKSVKLKYGYDGYFIKVFTDKDHYRFFSFDDETARENNSFDKGDFTIYETYLNILYLMSLKESDFILEETITPTVELFERLYTEEFFEMIDYTIPKNSQKVFKTSLPIFYIDRGFEKDCLQVMNLILNDSKVEAKRVVNESKQLNLSRTAKRYLNSRIDGFDVPEPGSRKARVTPKGQVQKVVTENASVPTQNSSAH